MFLAKNRQKFVVLISFLVLLNLIWLFINYASRRDFNNDYGKINTKLKRNWHDYTAMKAALVRTGPGEVGSAVIFDEHEKYLYNEYGYNAVLSDEISINRSVPDTRPGDCQILTYNAYLPKAAIIIIFYNERLSVLLRTVHGIINRTPDELIQEIILVDDCSTYSELHGPLTDYLSVNLPPERSKVQLIRLPKRSGLMAARMTGARAASKESKILIFMDAHFEVNYNWLPPLLEPIALNPKACTCPTLDQISFKSFRYQKNDPFRGYFNWKLRYKFLQLKPEEYAAPAKNFREYILMGAALAIGAEFFWNLGGFDEGMILWGGEQFELSFKIWMCGGEIIQVPCSRMAHLFRDASTKASNYLYGNYSFLHHNYHRLIKVWMDEKHSQYVFKRLTDIERTDPGDLTERFAIRDRLKCKSFSWMMDNIMPDLKEKYPPSEPNDLGSGFLRPVGDPKLCIALNVNKKITLEECPVDIADTRNKHWIYTWRGEIRTAGDICLESNRLSADVRLYSCHDIGGNQKWFYDRNRQVIAQVQHNMCILAEIEQRLVKLSNCDFSNLTMKWTITHMNQTEMNKWESKLGWNSKF